jgi:hypothetical protein
MALPEDGDCHNEPCKESDNTIEDGVSEDDHLSEGDEMEVSKDEEFEPQDFMEIIFNQEPNNEPNNEPVDCNEVSSSAT